ncbi:BT4734/BF3469 family protein [uncultured Croceitalea sp.]|uniref:BT4734/BF3469 family protein n=1 Tax=uncultured Croceitalea sp. TaxID=1798908 RepID=UPI00374FCE11
MKVSRFNNIYDKNVIQSELLDELMDIKQGKYKNIIEQCRYYTSKKKYDSYKTLKINLPTVTFCGTFENGRKLQNLASYNKIMILDIDHVEVRNITLLKDLIQSDKYIYSVWLSPSGEGLKALVKIDGTPEEHKASFASLKEYFRSNYEIELDNSGSDITRLCFVSWDENLFLNTTSEVYVDKATLVSIANPDKKTRKKASTSLVKSAFATEGLNKPEHRKMISLIIKYLRRKNLTITNSFDEWFRVAIAIASTFSYDLGEKYYLRLCEMDKEKHDELESKNILKYCYNSRNLDTSSTISFGTIVFYAKEKGFITKKDKFTS